MYLKALELNGFKSFPDKTVLTFEPGMSCIVGPNGCGKSNVSDSIRWVLGEQSAKALRGSQMADCIFNGTDSRKPLGMAEVSITFSECEETLGVDYNEVTITRRVFRSGEGQYFLNKTPCRLKDIQRLFMDTGVGTNSYSLMEQGRIDRVLSSHPDDRREIFEEASGITKFKADKKEAMRKLDYTEANLLRLADVIREVKRQIGSLQRQASKAKRYKELRDLLRKLELCLTKDKVGSYDSEIILVEQKLAELTASLDGSQLELKELDDASSALRASFLTTEREISAVMEAEVQASSKLDHVREVIKMNTRSIEEYSVLTKRDTVELDHTRSQIDQKSTELTDATASLERIKNNKAFAEAELTITNNENETLSTETHNLRASIQKMRDELIGLESLVTRLQNRQMELEHRDRSTEIQKEKLAAEKNHLSRIVMSFERKHSDMQSGISEATTRAELAKETLAVINNRISQIKFDATRLQDELSVVQTAIASKTAQVDMLASDESSSGDLPAGTKLLLDKGNPLGVDPGIVLGELASHLDIDQEYRVAAEAVLRAWLDAVVVSDIGAAVNLLKKLEHEKKGSTRMIAVSAAEPMHYQDRPGMEPLVKHIRCPESIKNVIGRLTANVYIVESLDLTVLPFNGQDTFVTKQGLVMRAEGTMEYWSRDLSTANPLSRKHNISDINNSIADIQTKCDGIRQKLNALRHEEAELEGKKSGINVEVAQLNRHLAQKEGEASVIDKERNESKDRLETVTYELENLIQQTSSSDAEKTGVRNEISEAKNRREITVTEVNRQTHELNTIELKQRDTQSRLTEQRIHCSSLTQKLENLESSHKGLMVRLQELDDIIKGRTEGIRSYEETIKRLTLEVTEAQDSISALEQTVLENKTKAEGLQKNRDKQALELQAVDKALSERRAIVEKVRDEKSETGVKLSELKMRRQNQIDRVTSEYNITTDQIGEEPEPEWENGIKPTPEEMETEVAELRTKIDSMGPVNLVAIEEYKEHEERHTFLTQQEQDLVTSKAQLMEFINNINKTTSDMFKVTFDKVNENFDVMFKRLFNGGTAKLVLVNEEDVLDCGIEIIARPPGKRLQNVSLLSGGERTMTAVALLFAIYLIKPSPFCLLDELDAALDESNISRFVNVLKDFLNQSQFVVITHNKMTISGASILYGVTMPEKGVSKLISMRFRGQDTNETTKELAAITE